MLVELGGALPRRVSCRLFHVLVSMGMAMIALLATLQPALALSPGCIAVTNEWGGAGKTYLPNTGSGVLSYAPPTRGFANGEFLSAFAQTSGSTDDEKLDGTPANNGSAFLEITDTTGALYDTYKPSGGNEYTATTTIPLQSSLTYTIEAGGSITPGSSGTIFARITCYGEAPTLSSLSVTEGSETGGTTVVLTGTNFTGASQVRFGSNTATYTVIDDTHISATSPAGAVGPVDVVVVTLGGSSATSTASRFTYLPRPVVTSLTPDSGSTAGGTTVEIAGSNLAGATSVTFDGIAAGITANSATGITVTTPAHAAGSVPVVVTAANGTSVSVPYTYAAPPTISSLSPSRGPIAAGTFVLVNGSNFTGVTLVTFDGVSVPFTAGTASQLTATAPAGTAGATVSVVVTAAGGASLGGGNQYTYVAAPVVTGLQTLSGPTAGGTSVVIDGANFSGGTVSFGGTAATVTATSATQITATAPAGAVGTVNVTVTTDGGTSATGAATQYTYLAAPTVTLISPAAGPLAGGNTVTVSGADLSGATAVRFGGVAGTIGTNSGTEITVAPPASAVGTVDVTVVTPGGTSVVTAASRYAYVAAPVVSSLAPARGAAAATTAGVVLTGVNFTGTTAVTFGGTPATFTVNSDSQITATAPARSAGTADVVVTAAGGVSTPGAGSQFAYIAPPVAAGSAVTVAANTANNPVAPDIGGGGTPDSLAVASGASHGSIGVSGLAFVYSPTPGYSGTDSFTYTATNIAGTSAPATVTITVSPPVLVLAPAPGTLPDGQVGTNYNQAFTASGGTTPYTFTVTAGATPTGVPLSGSGSLSGTPTAAGPTTFTVTATDAYGASGSGTYSLAIADIAPVANPVSITVSINSPDNTVGLAITGGTATTVAVPSPPAHGIATVNGTTISYRPAPGYAGADSFTYTASNASGTSAPAQVSVTVAIPTFTFSPPAGALPDAMVGASYTQAITVSGGTGSYTFALASGSLSAGLTLDPGTGILSGTATTVESASFTITATDSASVPGSVSYTLASVLPAPVTGPTALTVAANSGATTVPLNLSGGPATAVAVVTPAGHGSAVATGTSIAYTPAAGYSGSDSFTYTATNGSGTSAPATASITVTAPTLVLSPVAGVLPAGMIGTVYSQTVAATAGTSPYAYTLGGGTLPSGLTLDPASGAIAGTPTAVGTSSFSVTATDTFGATGSVAYTLAIADRPPVANAVTATVVRNSTANPIALSITGGAATSVAIASAPANGAAVASGTTITYTPNAGYVGADSFAYTAANASGTSTAAPVSITVSNPVLVLSPAAGTLPEGTAGAAYGQVLAASGGTAPYVYTLTGGALPPGLTLTSASGAISGTPSEPFTAAFSITATDATGASGVATYNLRILPATLALSPAAGTPLPAAQLGVAYSYAGFAASGGTGEKTFAAAGLPPGLAMSPTGIVSGTPQSAGSYTLSVTVTDAAGASLSAPYPLAVQAVAGAFVFSPAGGSLADAMPGEAYSQDISAMGGTGPLIYSLAGGTLPNGLVLNVSNGDLNGPLSADAAPGVYTFTIAARDGAGATGSSAFSITVVPRAVTVADKEVTVPPGGTPPNVYLNSGATGGPFIDAQLGTVTPAGAGTAEIIRGELAQAGPVAPVGFYMRFTPNPGFSGRAVVQYRLVSALGTSDLGTVAYALSFNADQVAEEVDGLVHDFVRARQNLLSSTIKVPGLLERRRMQNAREPVTVRMAPGETGMRAGFSTSLAQMEAARDAADGLAGAEPRRFNIWLDGAFMMQNGGARRPGESEENDRWGSFALLSVGMDYLLSEHALIGISAHFDRMTDPADEDSQLTGNGWFAGPYLSLEIGQGVFFDTSLLYGGSSNDIDTQFFDGKFDTTRWMWDGSIKGEWVLDEATVITPKLRAVYLTETVRDYAVGNDAGDRILLEGFSMEQLRASIGAEIERKVVLSNGMVLTPRLGLTVGIAGLDGEGTFATVSAGAALQTPSDWTFDFALLFDIEGEGDVGLGARARVSTRF